MIGSLSQQFLVAVLKRSINHVTFDKKLCATFLISCGNRIGCVIIGGAVVDDHNPLCALMLKNIPKQEER